MQIRMRTGYIMFAALTLAAVEQGGPHFHDVTGSSGIRFRHQAGTKDKNYLMETTGSGAALFDYNNDGLLDIFLVNSEANLDQPGGASGSRLYKNLGGMRFADVTAAAKLTVAGFGMGAAAADFDNDGWRDLYVTAYPRNALFRNNGDGTFRDVTAKAGVAAGNWSTGAAWGDYDADGDLDLYVSRYVDFDPRRTSAKGKDPSCSYRGALVACGPRGLPGLPDVLYRNNGDGTFTDVSRQAGIRDPRYYGFNVLWLDYNGDGRQDIFVANDATPNFLWHNNGDGTFRDAGAEAGVAYNENGVEQACMGASAADFNNDGLPDIFVTNFSDDDNTLYRNNGDGLFTDVTRKSGLAGKSWLELGWGTGIVDFDNDGWRDIFVANGHIYPEVERMRMDTTYRQKQQLFRNTGQETFDEVTGLAGADFPVPRSARGASFADLNNDGCIDIVLNNMDDAPAILQNQCGTQHHWLALDLEGARSNRDAIGARATVAVGDRKITGFVSGSDGYLGTSDRRLWFGLGRSGRIDAIEIVWPSGAKQRVPVGAVDRIVKVREGS